LKNKSIFAKDILDILNNEALNYNFPMPNNYNAYNAAMRLNVFRSSMEEWLIVFQMINFIKGNEFINEIYVYGSMLDKQGLLFAEQVLEEVDGFPFWNCNNDFILNPNEFKILLRGELMEISISENQWQAAHISKDLSMPIPVKILRLLVHLYENKFFLTQEELLRKCEIKNKDLHYFLEFKDWQHVDLSADEILSSSVSFSSLAKALEKNDPAIYQCTKELYNSRWYYWDEDYFSHWI
jgi:hypothetical protein